MQSKKYTVNRLGSFTITHNLTATPFKSWNLPDVWLVLFTKSRDLVKEMRANNIEEASDNDILIPTQQFVSVLASDAHEAVKEGVEAYNRNRVKYTPKPKEGVIEGEREEKGKENQKSNEGIQRGETSQRKQRGPYSRKS